MTRPTRSADPRHRSAAMKAQVSQSVREAMARPEVSAQREAYFARQRKAQEAKVATFLAIDRSCAVCGETLEMRDGETLWRFKMRQTCSSRCAHRLQGLAMVATKRLIGLQKPKIAGTWPPGISFAGHDSAEAAANHGSRWMPESADFHSFIGSSGAACADHRWAGL